MCNTLPQRFQSANNRVFNSEISGVALTSSADGRLFQSANNRVFNSEMSRVEPRTSKRSFQSANNRVFNSEGRHFRSLLPAPYSPFPLTLFFDPLFFPNHLIQSRKNYLIVNDLNS